MSKSSCYQLSGVDSVPEIVSSCDHTGCVVLLEKNFAMFVLVSFYLKSRSISKSPFYPQTFVHVNRARKKNDVTSKKFIQ